MKRSTTVSLANSRRVIEPRCANTRQTSPQSCPNASATMSQARADASVSRSFVRVIQCCSELPHSTPVPAALVGKNSRTLLVRTKKMRRYLDIFEGNSLEIDYPYRLRRYGYEGINTGISLTFVDYHMIFPR